MPQEGFTYGRANRPQTPIDGIISNMFGEESSQALQSRYGKLKAWRKDLKSPKGEIKYTKAKLRADEFVKAKSAVSPFAQAQSLDFKLKRFQNIESRIDHKR